MAKKGENRELVTLSCTVCKEKNYRTPKNRKNTTERLELNKYCPRCQKHTAHKWYDINDRRKYLSSY